MSKKKEETLKEFVENFDGLKKLNPKDLSADQDKVLAIMNLIGIEEHLAFTGAKTEKTAYYDLIKEIRRLRGDLMRQIIVKYEGEVWCISKHLLSAAMRLMEVATKYQDMGRDKDAHDLFDKSYELYCLFWGLNSGMISEGDVEWIKDAAPMKSADDAFAGKPAKAAAAKVEKIASKLEATEEGGGFMAKLKATVKKAVDCCIE